MHLRRLHLGTGILVLSALLVMILGPLVRAEDAGLACPDWPLCFGHVVPPYEYRVYLEFIHRVFAALLSLGFLVWVVVIFYIRELRAQFWKPAVLALIFLTMQILLGGATITQKLAPYVVKSHLLNALLFLSPLLYVWNRSREKRDASPAPKSIRILSVMLLVFVFLQIYLGGRVSTNEAGLACTDFPACYRIQEFAVAESSEWKSVFFPPMKGHVEMHMSHRFMAYLLCILAGVSLFLYETNRARPVRVWIRTVCILLTVQVLLGALNVVYAIPVPITVAHSAVALFLYATSFLNSVEAMS